MKGQGRHQRGWLITPNNYPYLTGITVKRPKIIMSLTQSQYVHNENPDMATKRKKN